MVGYFGPISCLLVHFRLYKLCCIKSSEWMRGSLFFYGANMSVVSPTKRFLENSITQSDFMLIFIMTTGSGYDSKQF